MHTLQAVPKIGKVMATKLWDLLGPETLDVLNAPDAHKRLQQAGWGTKNQCAYLMSLWNKGKGEMIENVCLHECMLKTGGVQTCRKQKRSVLHAEGG